MSPVKSGVIKFRSQKDIIADRQKETELQYKELQKRVGKIVKTNYSLASNILKSTN